MGAAGQRAIRRRQWRGARRRLLRRCSTIRSVRPKRSRSLIRPGGARARNGPRWPRGGAVVTLAGVDAHATPRPRAPIRATAAFALPLPGYESSFRVLSIHVAPDRPLTGDAAADAARADARDSRRPSLHRGRRRRDAAVVRVHRDQRTAAPRSEGDELARRRTGDAARPQQRAAGVHDRSSGTAPSVVGADHHEQDFTVQAPAGPGVYWVEIRATGGPRAGPVTWIRSNPIYVRERPSAASAAVDRAPQPTTQRADLRRRLRRRLARRARSDVAGRRRVAPIVGGAELRFRYGLAGGASAGQVAALAARHAARRRAARSR